jgi:serine/threonine protein kinase
MAHDDERNMIRGLLVQRLGFAAPDAALAALEVWRVDMTRPLLEVFVERGLITAAEWRAIEGLAAELERRHGSDPGAALAALLGGALPADDERTQTMPGSAGVATRYEILGEFSRGGMGMVLRANDAVLGREVLLKQILPEADADPARRVQFSREAHTSAALEHPNIAPVYDAGALGERRPFYVMRYIRGDTLKQAIARHHPGPPGETPAARSLRLRDLLGRFVAVCGAVAYAHARGVLHRDIKPANILLGDFGETQLIDWGLAKVGAESAITASPSSGTDSGSLPPLRLDDSGSEPTKYGQAKGTPAYMAPEQATGDLERFGPATDVYGLGATLYHILAGRAAFQGDSREFLADVIRGVFPRPRQVNPEVAPALEAICLKAMAREPGDRYPTAKDLAADIERWLADEPVAVYREPWTKQVFRFAKRHRTAMTAAGVLVATSLVGLVVNNVLVRRQRDIAVVNERVAKTMIQELGKEIGDDAWAVIPNYELRRLDIVHVANELIAEQIGVNPESRELRLDAVDGLHREGNLARILARYGDADRLYARADELIDGLLAAAPGDPAALRARLNLLAEQCVLRHLRGDPAAGEGYRGALERVREYAGRFPRGGFMKNALRLKSDYGGWQIDDGRPAEGAVLLREAVEGYAVAGPSFHDGIDHTQMLLAATLCELSRAEDEAGDPAAAIATADRAVAAADVGLATARVANHPDIIRLKAAALLQQAIVAAKQPDQRDRALALATDAVEIFRGIATRNPLIASNRDRLADALSRRAEMLYDAGRVDDFREDIKHARQEVGWRDQQPDLFNATHETAARVSLLRARQFFEADDLPNARPTIKEARDRIEKSLQIQPRAPESLRLQRRIEELAREIESTK